MTFTPTRLLSTYEDNSELLFYIREEKYFWLRPNADRTRMREQRIMASTDNQARKEVRRLIQKECQANLNHKV